LYRESSRQREIVDNSLKQKDLTAKEILASGADSVKSAIPDVRNDPDLRIFSCP
jgi:hypothetical protein